MLTRLRNQLGVPGILAIAALVFAMVGGAYAASGPDGGKATASAKGKTGKRGPRGPRGLKGAAGPAGPAGPQGPAGANGAAGAKGDAGAKGANGADGDDGADGTSVTVTPLDPLEQEECEETGGALVKEATPGGEVAEVCNGEQGPPGPPGDPWTPESQLPEGASLTGGWSLTASSADTEVLVPLSFPIPLVEELLIEKVHYQSETGFATNCPGSVSAPTAAAGHLCVYYSSQDFLGGAENATFSRIVQVADNPLLVEGEPGEPATNRSGAALHFTVSAGAGEMARGGGTFAVTAPEEE